MWTVEIIEIIDEGTTKTVFFKFTDGNKIISGHKAQGFTSDEQIKKYAENQIKAYTDKDSMTLDVGVLDFTPSIPPKPTEEEVAQQKYQIAKQELSILKIDLDLKLVTQNEYDAKLAEVKVLKV